MVPLHAASGMQTRPVHVLALPYSGLIGHVNPLMSLCHQLAAHGVAVTFAYSQSYYDRSQAIMSRSSPWPDAAGAGHNASEPFVCSKDPGTGAGCIRVVGVPDGLVYQDSLSPDSPRLFSEAAIAMEDELVELARRLSSDQHPAAAGPITCIISDVFVVCASSVARRLGIPHVAFWTQSAASFAAHVVATQNYSALNGSAAAAGEYDDGALAAGAALVEIPGCPALTLNELPTFLQSLDPAEYFFSYLTTCFARIEDCPRILLNTFDELEPESLQFIDKRQNIYAIGPLLPKEYITIQEEGDDDDKMKPSARLQHGGLASMQAVAASTWATDERCFTWLDSQKPRSVLFVSFGSLALMSEAQIEELAVGLEAAGCPFLMVVREALMEGQSARFPTGFQERMLKSGMALFVPWAPQLQVLAHSSVGGFLTHSGWNSTLEGICKGLPFLCWPYFADQLINCRCIVDAWKIGLELKDNSKVLATSATTNASLVGRHLIEEKIKYLMDMSSGASIRDTSSQLRMAASKAVLDVCGSSHLKLKSFVSWLYEATS